MKKTWALGLLLGSMVSARECVAQFRGGAAGYGGNAGGSASAYGGSGSVYGARNRLDPEANEQAKRAATYGEYVNYGGFGGSGNATERRAAAPTVTLDAGVLMNVKADEYVAVFGVSEEAPTAAEASAKMNATVAAFKTSLSALGVRPDDSFVDFVAQVRIYTYKIEGNTATEELAGFELKKNISVRFTGKALLDRMAEAAARERIYDLIKVDYVVRDTQGIQEKLRAEAARIIARKAQMHQGLLGASRLGAAQVVASGQASCHSLRKVQCAMFGATRCRTGPIRCSAVFRAMEKRVGECSSSPPSGRRITVMRVPTTAPSAFSSTLSTMWTSSATGLGTSSGG